MYGNIGTDVPVQFGDSSSNGSRDIRLPLFARTTTTTTQADGPYDTRAKRRLAFVFLFTIAARYVSKLRGHSPVRLFCPKRITRLKTMNHGDL